MRLITFMVLPKRTERRLCTWVRFSMCFSIFVPFNKSYRIWQRLEFLILICILLLGSLSVVVQKSPQVSNYISQSFYTFDSVSYCYHFPPNSTAQNSSKRAVCYNYIVTTKNLPRLYKQKHKNISLKWITYTLPPIPKELNLFSGYVFRLRTWAMTQTSLS